MEIKIVSGLKKKKSIIYLLFFLFTLLICLGLYIYSNSVYDVKTIYGNTETTTDFPITKDMMLSQEFEATDLRGAGVNFKAIEDIEDIPNVNVEIKLLENDTNIEISSMIFNTIQTGVGAKELMVPSGEIYKEGTLKYRLEIRQLTADEDNRYISVLTEQSPNQSDTNKMMINDTEQYAKISVTAIEDVSINFVPVFSLLLIITIMGTVYMIVEKKAIENVFIIAFIGLGVIYSLLMSPFVIPDEATHYDRSYSLSNRFMGFDDIMRREDDETLNTYLHTPDKHTVQETLDYLFSISNSNEMVEGTVIHSKGVKVIPYIGPAIGITIGKLLHLGAYPMFYLGRICNLLIASILIYLAIKLIPVGKSILFVISFFPMTMHLVGSYSYDGLVISSTMLFVAYILYLKYTKKFIEKRDFLVLTILPILFLSSKSFGYMAFLFLLFLLPWKTVYKEQKKCFLLYTIIGGFLFLYFSGTITLIKDLAIPSSSTTSTESDTLSVSMHTYSDVIRSPLKYMVMVASTFYRNVEVYIKDMIGNNLCWYTFPVKEFIIYLYILVLLFAGLNREKHLKISLNDRLIMGFVGIVSCGIVVLSMAIAFTPENMNSILGVQGRYFIPIIILIILAVYNAGIQLDRNITTNLLYLTIILQIITIMDIMLNIMRI